MRRHATFPWLTVPKRSKGVPSKNKLRVPRMASAVRISALAAAQMELKFTGFGPQIFVHEGARQALERRLQLAFEGPVQLSVTDNRRRMVTHSLEDGILGVRAHMMFLDAPDRVKEALVRYVVDGGREASTILGVYIEANSFRIRADQPFAGPLKTRGSAHDLERILQEVNARYFSGVVTDVQITWGNRTRPRSQARQSIKLGSYSSAERLIRIHPVLDAEWVPRYFVTYIVYHELLHHLIPPVRQGSRTVLHTPDFLRLEQEFKHYERALAWEQKHMRRLLRWQ